MGQPWVTHLHCHWYTWDSCLLFQWINRNFEHRPLSILTQLFGNCKLLNFSATYVAWCTPQLAVCFWIGDACRWSRRLFLLEFCVHMPVRYSCKLSHEGHRKFSRNQLRSDHRPLNKDPGRWTWQPVEPLSCILGCPFYSVGSAGSVCLALANSLLLEFEYYQRGSVAFIIAHLGVFLDSATPLTQFGACLLRKRSLRSDVCKEMYTLCAGICPWS